MAATVNIGTLEGLLRWKADDADLQKSLADVAKKADVSKSQLNAYNRELAGVDAAYKRVVASIDPAAAATQRYEKAHQALSNAYKAGLISIGQYSDHLEKLTDQQHNHGSGLEALVGKVLQLTGFLGPLGTAGKEAGEGLEKAVAGGAGFTELLGSLGALLPVAIALAAALVGVGIAFEAFEFLKEAVEEGVKFEAVVNRLNDSLRTTGSYSGLSAHEIIELAGSFALLTGRTKEELVQAGLVLTHFRHLTEESYPKAMDASIAYARAMGITVAEAARKLGPILDGNTRSLRGLKEAGVDLTKGQLLTMNRMVEQGHIVEYQNLLFSILAEKVGKASGVHETLITQVGRAKFVLSEFKEGIASEVIPALEDAFSSIIQSIGGWEKLRYIVVGAAHEIGDVIRTWVYEQMTGFFEIRIGLNIIAIAFDNAVISIAGSVEKLTIAGSAIPGLTGQISSALSSVFHAAVNNASKDLHDDTAALNKNTMARAGLVTGLESHRQALEGDEKVHKKLKPAQDDVASAQKKVNDLMAEADKIIRAYTDSFTDHTKKIEEQIKSQERLLAASQLGTLASAQARQEEERSNAIKAATMQLDKEHRTEIEKLTDLQNKAIANKLPDNAAKIKADIDAANEAYGKESAKIAELTGRQFDLKHSTDENNKSNAETDIYLAKILVLQSDLTDALDGTSLSSREMSIQLETQARQTAKLTGSEGDLADSIAETVRRQHESVNAMKDTIEVSRELTKLNNQVSLQTAISRIDTSQSASLQQVEQQYLTIIAGIGKGSIAVGQQIIDATQAALEAFGFHVGNLSDKIKEDLKALQDADTSKLVAGASKSPYDLYREERVRIETYLADSTKRTLQQTKDAQAYLEKLNKEHWTSLASEWATALNYLGSLFGGIFAKIASLASSVSSAIQSGNQIGGLASSLGASAGAASTIGAVAGWVGVFVAIEGFVKSAAAASKAVAYSGAATLMRTAGVDILKFSDDSVKIAGEIEKIVKSFGDALGGIITDLGVLSISVRNDGKYVAAWVEGQMIGHFASVDEAIQAALQYELQHGQATITGLSDLVRQGLSGWTAGKGDLDAELAFLQQLRAIDDLAKTQGQITLENTLHGLENLFQVLQQIDKVTPAVIQGFENIGNAITQAFQNWSDSITGRQKTASEELAARQAEALIFNARKAMEEADLKMKVIGFQAQYDILKAQGVLDAAELEGRRSTLIARGELLEAEVNIYQAQLDVIQAAIDATNAVLAELVKIPNIDPTTLKLPKTPHVGGGNGKQGVESFIDDRRFQLSIAGMDSFHQSLAQIDREYAAQLVAVGKDKKLREQLLALQQQETAAAIAAHQADVTTRYTSLTSPLSNLDQAIKPFEDMRKEIESAGYSAGKTAEMLSGLTKAEDEAVAKLQADVLARYSQLISPDGGFDQVTKQFADMRTEIESSGFSADKTAEMIAKLTKAEADAIVKLSNQQLSSMLGDLSNIIADSKTNTAQHILHNQLLRVQETINFQMKMIELRDEYVILKAKGKLTQDEIELLDKAFGWIDKNANILPGGKDWIPSFEQAANDVASAASNLSTSSDSLRSAAQSLIDYQTSLHTDSSLGLVDLRTALANSKADYEADRAKALTGDIDAIAKLKDFAETYRKNLIAFSPSSELVASVLSSIDDTINQIKSMPAVKAALSLTPDAQAIITNLGYVASGVGVLKLSTDAVNDNIKDVGTIIKFETPIAIADANANKQAEYQDAVLSSQKASADSLASVRDDMKKLADNVLAWRTESRGNVDEAHEQRKEANEELVKIANNTKQPRPLAGSGG